MDDRSILPVMPPELRPLVPLEGGRFAARILMTCTEELLLEIID